MLEELKTLKPDGTPPVTRISTAQAAQQIWNTLRMADAISSAERARWAAMYDNAPPLDQKQLDNADQSYRVNVSWGLAPMVLDMAQSGYNDLISSTEVFFECPTMMDLPPEERMEAERVIAEEVTNCIRSWQDFPANFLRLTNTFIREGVGIATFDDEWDWRFDAKGLSDFKISRKTKVGQENVDVACWLRFYSMSQLYQFIKDPELAAVNGWDVEAVKHVIIQSVRNSNTFTQWRNYEWEKLEIELRNNDYYWTYGTAQTQDIRIVHMMWQEFDGRYSYGIICDDQSITNKWLYHKVGRYSESHNAFTIYTYGVGNDYYHGIRGQGYVIYPIVGALNRAYCQLLEVGIFGSAPIFHMKDESAMASFQFTPCGAYSLMGGDAVVIPSGIVPNLSSGVMPIISAFTQMFREQTANANTQALIESPKEMTAAEVNARLGTIAKMSSSSSTLFYPPWESTLREMVRRMKRKTWDIREQGGKYIMQLHAKLLKIGGQRLLDAFFDLDTTRLVANRAIGSGSEAARLLAYNQLIPLMPYLPQAGQQNLIRDFFASHVQYRNVARYVSPTSSPGVTAQESIAWAQNTILVGGDFQPVLPNDNHFVHAEAHASYLAPLIQRAEQGLQVDPMSVANLLQGLQNLNEHLAEHVQYISVNPQGQKLVGQYKALLQRSDEVLHNGLLRVQKLHEQAATQVPDGEQPQGPSPEVLAKIENDRLLTQAKVQSLHATTQATIANKQAETDQRLAIKDATTAQDVVSKAAKNRVSK